MAVEKIRTLMLITQWILLAMQIATGIKWFVIPIVLLMIGIMVLNKYE